MKIVIALGGNALTPDGKSSYEELNSNIIKACKSIKNLANKNKIVIVSGSGPQIGSLILQNEIAKDKVPAMPLHVLDAELEGELGYLIERGLINELKTNSKVVTVLSQVLVDKKDSSFKKPAKFIGQFY